MYSYMALSILNPALATSLAKVLGILIVPIIVVRTIRVLVKELTGLSEDIRKLAKSLNQHRKPDRKRGVGRAGGKRLTKQKGKTKTRVGKVKRTD